MLKLQHGAVRLGGGGRSGGREGGGGLTGPTINRENRKQELVACLRGNVHTG